MANTLKVRLLAAFQGPVWEGNPGEEVELPSGEAARLVEQGLAELVKGGPKKRTATKKPKAEKATT